MATDTITPQIQNFLSTKKLIQLDSIASDKALCPRAGAIIFYPEANELYFYLVLPKQKENKSTPPDFQIGKGGRTVILPNGGHLDARTVDDLSKGTPLDPSMDALREAMEEKGLRLDNVEKLYVMGKVEFVSQTKGTLEPMWCMAVQVTDKTAFDTPLDPKTERCEWFSLNELTEALKGNKDSGKIQIRQNSVRTDHINILIDFAGRLMLHEQFINKKGGGVSIT